MSTVAFIDPNRYEKILKDSLKKNFGYNSFRPHQLEICLNILQSKDTFVLMSTGSGKSLTFQLPAVALHDLGYKVCTVVISPLISLIEDQVLSLKALGIPAGSIGGNASMADELRASKGEFVVLYATPEKIDVWKEGLKTLANNCKIICVAIDESHCVSEWGHDFRPHYRKISDIRTTLPSAIPIIALTATATTSVQADIISNLKLYQPLVIQTTFNRPNLKYFVANRSGKADLLYLLQTLRREQLADIARISGSDGGADDILSLPFISTLVYVNTKKDAEELCQSVRGCSLREFKAMTVAYYHAGMTLDERTAVHTAFLADKIQIVIATLAFGLGIHKPDIRLIIHFGITKSVEAYYQQTGRAGRDGHPARCYLLYNRQDLSRCFNIATSSNMTSALSTSSDNSVSFNFTSHTATQLHQMNEYAVGTAGCRRRYLLEYFGELYNRASSTVSTSPSGRCKCSEHCCDLCDFALANYVSKRTTTGGNSEDSGEGGDGAPGVAAIDLAREARLLLRAVVDTGECYGIGTPISILVGSHEKSLQKIHNFTQLPTFNEGSFHSREWWRAFGFQLSCDNLGLIEGVLTKGSKFAFEKFVVTVKGKLFLQQADNATASKLLVVPGTDLARLHAYEHRRSNSENTMAPENIPSTAPFTTSAVNIGSIFVTDGMGSKSGSPDEDGGNNALPAELRNKLEMVLRKVRAGVSANLGMIPGSVLSINQMSSLIECRPTLVQHLRDMDSWGAWRRANLGGYFVGAIAKFVEDFNINPVSPYVERYNAACAARASGAAAPMGPSSRAGESETSCQAVLLDLPIVPLYRPNYKASDVQGGDDIINENDNDNNDNYYDLSGCLIDNNDEAKKDEYEFDKYNNDKNNIDSNTARPCGDLSIVPSFSLAAQHAASSAVSSAGAQSSFNCMSYSFVDFDFDRKQVAGKVQSGGRSVKALSASFKTIQKRKMQNMITLPNKR